jgi:hypothetical protein
MLERVWGEEAYRDYDGPAGIELSLAQNNDPQEGARLVRAFLRIADPETRAAILRMIETMGSARGGD